MEYATLRQLILKDEKINLEVTNNINQSIIKLLHENNLDYSNFQDLEELRKLNNIVFLAGRCGRDYTQRVGESFKKQLDTEFLGEQNGAFSKKPKFIQEIYRKISEERFNFGSFVNNHFVPSQFIKYQQFIKDQNNLEIFVQIRTNVRGKDVHIFQLFNEPIADKAELEELCGAAARAGASKISVYTPYPPFQRQDKKDDGRVEISAKKYFNDIKDSCLGKLTRIFGFDFHNKAAQGHFDGPVDELTAIPYFALYFKNKFRRENICSLIKDHECFDDFKLNLSERFEGYYSRLQKDNPLLKFLNSNTKDEIFFSITKYCNNLKEGKEVFGDDEQRLIELIVHNLYASEIANCLENVVIVAPDGGAGKRATELAKLLGIPGNVVFGYKQRSGHSEVQGQYLAGDVKGKIAIICDDIIDSGGTILELAKKLKIEGASEVYTCTTHAELSPNVHKINKEIKNSLKDAVKEIKISIRLWYDAIKEKFVSKSRSIFDEKEIYALACNAYINSLDSSFKEVVIPHGFDEKGIYALACKSYVDGLPADMKLMFDSYPLADTEIASLAWDLYAHMTHEEQKEYQAEYLFWKACTIPDPILGTTILNKVITTDSVPPKHRRGYYEGCKEWMDVVSTTYLSAGVVRCNQLDRSVSTLIEDFKDYIQQDDAKLTFIDLTMKY